MNFKPGLTFTADGAEIGVYSENAKQVFVCLYNEAGDEEVGRFALAADGSGGHWAALPGLKEGQRYGLRVDGPYEPWRGHRFDVTKLLVDPYASRIDRAYALSHKLFEHGADTGKLVPKVIATKPIAGEPGRSRVAFDDTILYELNINGFTRLREDIAPELRGRFAALGTPEVIAHFKALGVTTIELMPADAYVDERHLPPLGLTNAWGYNAVVFGCPDPRLAPEGFAEVRRATDALHAAGLEVILDVVINHDGESDEFGPTLSLRGLDNALYLRLNPSDPQRYINDMGTGNCVALDRPPVVAMAIAALRRWVEYGCIDGFRFDLAPALGRRPDGFDPRAPLIMEIGKDPILSKTKLIAEPWDIGPGGYQLGHFPAAWAEWNDRFRDTARRFWRGDRGVIGELATRLSGSRDVFIGEAPPAKSVNFVVAHDGFTLADLVSYSHKHNEANGENNRDGNNENYSWNNGVEGGTLDSEILARRARDMRNLLALNILARGVPMLAMGSELGHSQLGNNNAYAQNNAISWIDWKSPTPDLISFVGRLTQLRGEHPALRPLSWLSGARDAVSGLADVEWRDAHAPMTSGAQWEADPGEALVAVFSAPLGEGFERVVLAFNRSDRSMEFALPEPRDGYAWRIRLDTSDESITDRGTDLAAAVEIAGRTTIVLTEERETESRVRPADRADIDALAAAVGISGDWWEVSGKHTVVTPHTKLALLDAMRLPGRSRAQARESLGRFVEETRARRLPLSVTLALDAPRHVAVRSGPAEAARDGDFRVILEDGAIVEGKTRLGEGQRINLPDGRETLEAVLELPELPIGRHKLQVDNVDSVLTIAPPECFSPKAVVRRRFGASAQIYALRRGVGDEGVGGFTALGEAAEAAGAAGAAYFGVSPLHALFTHDPARASPYHPSDRRFLNPLLIDILADGDDPGLDETTRADFAARFAGLARSATVDYELVSRAKFEGLRLRFAAFEAARAARPDEPVFADHASFLLEGGEELRSFALYEAISAERRGEEWSRWPAELRDGAAAALAAAEARLPLDFAFARYCQWLADRQFAAAARRASASGAEIGFYRDLAVGSAPDGAESWARAGELLLNVNVGAPPDPFSAAGQNWNLPPPDPIASARDGWNGLSRLASANMRHAGMLRIDHAMGLTRLFMIPQGARPAEGAYISYPADDLIGQVALQSQRHRCMVIGEDLGTVPDGFREKLTRAHIYGMKVLWFERDGAEPRPPVDYPAFSVACVSTHDLPTLAGWWSAADIGERLMLAILTPAEAEREIAARGQEKRVIVAALRRAGALGETSIDFDGVLSDTLAAAVHAFIADSGSGLASTQLDDLAGMTIATNLPGTDRERPNWRHRLRLDIETLFAGTRAKAVLAAMAAKRR
jgi:glycogen debranching enzyme GlgX/4-alpha-glucanotransferase